MSLTSGVHTIKMWSAECSQCHDIYDFDEGAIKNKKQAITEFRKLGWRIGKKNICPECMNKKINPQEYEY